MGTFITDLWVSILFIILIIIVKIVWPTISYRLRVSLLLGIIAMLIFSFQLISIISDVNSELDIDVWPIVWSIIYMLLFVVYIVAGGLKGYFKTETVILSVLREKAVGRMKGGFNWIDPFFERLSYSIDLRDSELKVVSTPDLQTAERGIKAKIKEISVIIYKYGDVRKIFNIEGGVETIKGRIHSCMDEFFIHKVGELKPKDLDTDKKETIQKMVEDLTEELNHFCHSNNYPYQVKNILIGDTELDAAYYEALAKIVFAKLNRTKEKIDANALLARIKAVGKGLLPDDKKYSDADRLKAAQVSLKIVTEDIQFKKFGIDPDSGELLKAIAEILKKK